MTTDPASLPIDQSAMWEATPPWIVGAYAVAVWVGLVGAVLLLMRRKLAEPLLLVSLLAVVVQFGGVLLVPALREVTPDSAYTLPDRHFRRLLRHLHAGAAGAEAGLAALR